MALHLWIQETTGRLVARTALSADGAYDEASGVAAWNRGDDFADDPGWVDQVTDHDAPRDADGEPLRFGVRHSSTSTSWYRAVEGPCAFIADDFEVATGRLDADHAVTITPADGTTPTTHRDLSSALDALGEQARVAFAVDPS